MPAFTPVGVEAAVRNLGGFLRGLGQMDKAIQSTGKQAGSIGSQFVGLGNSVLSVGATAGKVALGGIAALGAGVLALGTISTTTAISFESAFAGVLKTTDNLTDATGRLNQAGQELRQGFVDLSKEIPLTFEELAAIGELGGQLGVGKDALLDFTETIAALGVSTNLSTEEAATAIARFQNIFQVAAADMGQNTQQVGSAIVALGNNFATTERDITAFAERIAGAGQIAGLTQADVLGIGAALSSVGVEAEAGGTAVQKVLLAMNNAVNATSQGFVDNSKAIEKNVEKLRDLNADSARLEAQAPGLQAEILAQYDAFIAAGGAAEEFGRLLGDKTREKAFETATAIRELQQQTDLLRQSQGQPIDAGQLAKFAQVAGVAADDFKTLWEEDASQAFEMFVSGLAREGDNAANVLDELGLADQRLIRGFLSLAGAGDLLGNAIQLSNDAFAENEALQTEAAKRYATTESQLKILKNTLRATGDIIGSRFLPFINRLVSTGKTFVEDFTGPLADALDKQVVPAIENLLSLAGSLAGAFATGGTTGLVAALGITPQVTELIDKIIASVTNLAMTITDFLLPAFELAQGGGLLDILNQAIIFLNQNFETLQGAIAGIGAVLASAAIAAVLTGIATAIGALLSPIGLLIGASALLGAAWVNNWFNIQGVAMTALEIIQGVFAGIMAALQPAIASFQQGFATLTETLNSMGITWGDVWDGIVTVLQAAGVVIAGVIVTAISIITGFVNAIASGFARAMETIQQLINIWQQLQAAWQAGDILGVVQAIFDGIIAIFTGSYESLLAFTQGFIDGIIAFWEGLFDTLVGGSIIPDLINDIIGWFTMLPEAIVSALGGLGETIGNIFSGLFSGGETGPTFDTAQATAALTAITEAVAMVQAQFDAFMLSVSNFTTITLLTLQEMFAVVIASMMERITFVQQAGIIPLDRSIISIYTVTLPMLQATWISMTAIIVAQIQLTITNLNQMISTIGQAQSEFSAMADAASKGFDKIMDRIDAAIEKLQDLADFIKEEVVDAFEKMEEAAKRAAAAAREAGSASKASSGVGFQAGTPANTGGLLGLGFRIPAGFPNDSFGPFFAQSGEEMLITPRGTSIDEMVMSRLSNMPVMSSKPTVEINIGNINNGMDVAMLQNLIRRTVAEV